MKKDELWNRLVAKPPKMRLLVMLMCMFCTFNAMFANVLADKTVTIKSENISVKEALNMVKKQTGIHSAYLPGYKSRKVLVPEVLCLM